MPAPVRAKPAHAQRCRHVDTASRKLQLQWGARTCAHTIASVAVGGALAPWRAECRRYAARRRPPPQSPTEGDCGRRLRTHLPALAVKLRPTMQQFATSNAAADASVARLPTAAEFAMSRRWRVPTDTGGGEGGLAVRVAPTPSGTRRVRMMSRGGKGKSRAAQVACACARLRPPRDSRLYDRGAIDRQLRARSKVKGKLGQLLRGSRQEGVQWNAGLFCLPTVTHGTLQTGNWGTRSGSNRRSASGPLSCHPRTRWRGPGSPNSVRPRPKPPTPTHRPPQTTRAHTHQPPQATQRLIGRFGASSPAVAHRGRLRTSTADALASTRCQIAAHEGQKREGKVAPPTAATTALGWLHLGLHHSGWDAALRARRFANAGNLRPQQQQPSRKRGGRDPHRAGASIASTASRKLQLQWLIACVPAPQRR